MSEARTARLLSPAFTASVNEGGAQIVELPRAGLAASVERHLRDYFAAHENGLPATGLYDRILNEIERPLLRITLAQCHGNQLRAAELLGLNRNTLRKKLRDLGLGAGRTRKQQRGSLAHD